jgi:GAF domain-containing protein
MADELTIIDSKDKRTRYASLLPQIEALISTENDLVANLANIAAALKEGMRYFWVGFYIVKEKELVLGPFQGPVACTRIKIGHGVCGTSWSEKKTIIVEDVDKFPGHITCNSGSKSEIVVPAKKDGHVKLLLDVDSDKLSEFDKIDKDYLEYLVSIIESKL